MAVQIGVLEGAGVMTEQGPEHLMPWWLGYVLASPLRRLTDSPSKIVGPYIEPGMTVLDVGSAMGYFTLPMAKMVGEDGRVVAVDVQAKMLIQLAKRVVGSGLRDRIDLRRATPETLGIGDLPGRVDFALAFAVLHEAASKRRMLDQIHQSLTPTGRLLLVEPGHVEDDNFFETTCIALESGFVLLERPMIRGRGDRSLLLGKAGDAVA